MPRRHCTIVLDPRACKGESSTESTGGPVPPSPSESFFLLVFFLFFFLFLVCFLSLALDKTHTFNHPEISCLCFVVVVLSERLCAASS